MNIMMYIEMDIEKCLSVNSTKLLNSVFNKFIYFGSFVLGSHFCKQYF